MLKNSDSLIRRRSSVDKDVIPMVLEECDVMEQPTGLIKKDIFPSSRRQSFVRSSIQSQASMIILDDSFDRENSDSIIKHKGVSVESTIHEKHTTSIEMPKMSTMDMDCKVSSPNPYTLDRSASESKLMPKTVPLNQRMHAIAWTLRSKMEQHCDINFFSSQEEETNTNSGSSEREHYSFVAEPGSATFDESPNDSMLLQRKMRYGLYFIICSVIVVFSARNLWKASDVDSSSVDESNKDTYIVSPYTGVWEVTDHSNGEIAKSKYGCSLVQSSDTKFVVVGECGLSIAHAFKSDIEDGSLGTKVNYV